MLALFLDHCRNGDVGAVQRCVARGTLHPRWLDLGLTTACGGGHLHVAQWLVRQEGVSLLGCGDRAFWWACGGGQAHVARWLLAQGHVTLHKDHDVAFLDACRNGHVHVGRWLLSLDPGYDAWPSSGMRHLQVWSPMRDAWMRAVSGPGRQDVLPLPQPMCPDVRVRGV